MEKERESVRERKIIYIFQFLKFLFAVPSDVCYHRGRWNSVVQLFPLFSTIYSKLRDIAAIFNKKLLQLKELLGKVKYKR